MTMRKFSKQLVLGESTVLLSFETATEEFGEALSEWQRFKEHESYKKEEPQPKITHEESTADTGSQVLDMYICERCGRWFDWLIERHFMPGDGSRRCPQCSTEFVRKMRNGDLEELVARKKLMIGCYNCGIPVEQDTPKLPPEGVHVLCKDCVVSQPLAIGNVLHLTDKGPCSCGGMDGKHKYPCPLWHGIQ
jgi:DNA-directed RNA polymerase subunit RPC12/RpoP